MGSDELHRFLASGSFWDSRLLWTLSTILCIAVGSALYFSNQKLKSLDEGADQSRRRRAQSREKRAQNPFAIEDDDGNDDVANDKETQSLSSSENDVWAERRRRGIAPASSSSLAQQQSKSGETSKPFQSSYYYAHNSQNSKGGYSDGLSIEDFTMNGPRLLSRGGKPTVTGTETGDPVQHQDRTGVEKGNEQQSETKAGDSTPIKKQQTSSVNTAPVFLPITKYLWDDPGESSGIAYIRIDTLPSPSNKTLMIPWKNSDIIEATAQLSNNSKGLIVVARSAGEFEFRLEIKELYGSVTAVKVLTTKLKKRLIIELHKTKGFWDRSNLNAWPQPYQKA